MLKIIGTHNKYSVSFNDKSNNSGIVNNEPFEIDIASITKDKFHFLFKNNSYQAELIKVDKETKTVVVKINNNVYSFSVKNEMDELLEKMGIDSSASKKIKVVKAPMPGMVLDVFAIAGQEVKQNDALLVLEAMKMENIIKSPIDGKIKKVSAQKSVAVEKNEPLILFE
jgi:biotin carboxyl carrier protein